MDLERLNMLDDHIFVLRNLMDMISLELTQAMQERQHLLEVLGIAETKPTEATKDTTPYSWTSETSTTELREEKAETCSDRSPSPTSPLSLHLEGIDLAEEIYLAPDHDVPPSHDTADHDSAVHFSEDLPTPRGASCLEPPAAEEADPDVNNALSDSDDDETPQTRNHESKDPTLAYTGDDAGKVSRPTSSLNNVNSDYSDLEEESEPEDTTKPHSWISNTMYTSAVLDMIRNKDSGEVTCERVEEHSTSPCFEKVGRIAERFLPVKAEDATVSLRSLDETLMERASSAVRLSNDLKRLKVELLDREAHIEFLHEKHHRYKEALKREIQRREHETREWKTQTDQATSAKFLMFCKLQSAEARVAELEEALRSCRLSAEVVSYDDEVSDEEELLEDGVVDMDVHAQRVARSFSQHLSNDYPHKKESVGHHPLQETLSQTYKRLLRAERRGDKLQLRVQQLEKDISMKTKTRDHTSLASSCSANSISVKATKKTTRPGVKETQKPKTDLGHARSRTVEKESTLASKSALRSKHERGSHRSLTETRPSTRVSKAKRWSS